MSATAQVNERLAALTAAGTSVWLDQIRRSMIEEGELQRLVAEDSLRGVTSNPSIFEKAILGSDDYDSDLEAMAKEGLDARQMYDRIAVQDVQMGCDVLRSAWDESGGTDGFVSLEVGPELARDEQKTIDEARHYWKAVDRPNVMIKIPGTPECVPAIEQATSEGININVTLLFSIEAYEAVAEAFIRGLERRREQGESIDMRSVASFFVSRVDSEVDKRLEKLGRSDLQGKAGLANARAAYRRFEHIFYGDRFAELREAGAAVQRPLWASTGVKNPSYPETMYVDGLVGRDTVNTMPMATLHAAAEKADIREQTAALDPTADLEALAQAGIDLGDVTEHLLEAGIDLFVEAMEGLIRGVEDRREGVVTDRPPTISSSTPDDLEPAIAEQVRRAVSDGVAQRIWRKDDTLWGRAGAPEVSNRLGWLTISESMLDQEGALQAFVEQVKADGYTDAVLLGMGGSSLGPEVIRRSFGDLDGALRLQVLDSTDPGAVLAVERSVDLGKTLFVVSSKSGGTIETRSHFEHFHAQVAGEVGEEKAGAHFVAVTDPGSPLAELAHERGFRHVFENDPDIGGRYSVLSYFGLVPAALMGVPVGGLLQRCQVAEQNCTSYDSTQSNSGLWLGLVMGTLAQQGRDKLTFLVSEPIDSFGLWVEQLIAESLGKEGKGVVPVADEPVGEPGSYGDDRVFAYLRNADEPDEELDKAVEALADAGHPTLTLSVDDATDLGRIFFFAEFATAVAGWVLGINPFDQPNVQEAKDNTAKVLEGYESEGRLPEIADAGDDELKALLGDAKPPNYVAIMAYVAPSDELDAAIAELRSTIRDATRATTTFGYGPRFLHSTGQLHKGGPATGRFLQLVGDGDTDVDIPGAKQSFETLKNAQAVGDLQTLREHDLPAERVRLEGDPAQAVSELTAKLRELL